jgi:hypothetical protein
MQTSESSMMLPYNKLDGSDVVADAIERLTIMYKQEQDTYNIQSTDQQIVDVNKSGLLTIDIRDCRYKMAVWCYDLVDFCQMSANTVESALSILDRFIFTGGDKEWINRVDTVMTLCTQAHTSAWTNKKVYQLIAMSAMYTAVKINEPVAFDPCLVSAKLSRGTYSPLQIENTEAILLETLAWKVHLPTVLSFVNEYMVLIIPILQKGAYNHEKRCRRAQLFLSDPYTQESFYDLIQRQTKLCTLDFNFVTVPASIRALCCIINALESLGINDALISEIEQVMLDTKELYQTNEYRLFCIATRQVMYEMLLSNDISSTSSFLFCRTCPRRDEYFNCVEQTEVSIISQHTKLDGDSTIKPVEPTIKAVEVTIKPVVAKSNSSKMISPRDSEIITSKDVVDNVETTALSHSNSGMTPTILPYDRKSIRLLNTEEIEFSHLVSPSSTMLCE